MVESLREDVFKLSQREVYKRNTESYSALLETLPDGDSRNSPSEMVAKNEIFISTRNLGVFLDPAHQWRGLGSASSCYLPNQWIDSRPKEGI